MNTISKALVGTVAAGAMAMAAVAPANAQDRGRGRDRDDGISAGEVIAGAVVLGGIAAVIAASDNHRDRDYRYNDRDDRDYRSDRRGDWGGRDYDDHDYRGGYRGYNGYNSRIAVDECVRAAERDASRYSRSNAEVFEVTRIDRSRGGFEVSGRIALRNGYRGRGWGGDYRRGYRNTGWDEGGFSCSWRNGHVYDVDYRGLRGL